MSGPAPARSDAPAPGASEALTAERVETKYLVPAERVAPLMRELAACLPAHRFTGDGANRLPDPRHFVTTVYFDTPARALYRSAARDEAHSVKLRAKEYYDAHPSLAELATDPADIVRYDPFIWFELKRRDGAHTRKDRFRLRKRDVPALLSGGEVDAEAIARAGSNGAALEPGARALVEFCRALGEPLLASAVVNYRRLSFQEPGGALRVTLDVSLAFHAPPPDLWSRMRALVGSTLGRAVGAEPRAVLEVKRRAAVPSWLTALLDRTGVAPSPFSKFVAATEVVHGAPPAR